MIDDRVRSPTIALPTLGQPFERRLNLSSGERFAIGVSFKRESKEKRVAVRPSLKRGYARVPGNMLVANQSAALPGFCDDRVVANLAGWIEHVRERLLEAHHRVVKDHPAPLMQRSLRVVGGGAK